MISAKLGIIGGSGLYDIPGVSMVGKETIATPFGDPSDAITIFEIKGVPVAFLPRHGIGHRINPTHVNARANIFALKMLGVQKVVSVSAVGSLRETIHPRDFVIPDQIIDRTKCRVNSFFEPYAVHTLFAHPFCSKLSRTLYQEAVDLGGSVHLGGTYVCMEGPLFSTKAESEMHRAWGASVIGMTALPEAKLAREAEMCYSTVALVTDYDVWKDDEIVSISMILDNIKANTERVKELILNIVSQIDFDADCDCMNALKYAFITDPALIPDHVKKEWKPLLQKYVDID